MNLILLNVEDNTFIEEVNRQTDGSGDDAVFVDWVSEKDYNFGKQIDVMSSLPDGVKMIVFDRFGVMGDDIVQYLTDKGAVLLEPVVQPRKHFKFMPYWLNEFKKPEIPKIKNPKSNGVGFIGDVLYPEAENYLLKICKHFNIPVSVHTTNRLDKSKYDSLNGVFDLKHGGTIDMSSIGTALIVSSQDSYDWGVMPDIRYHIKHGVLPLVSDRHKWMYSMFGDFIISDYKDIAYWCNTTINHDGYIDDIISNINRFFPEMMVGNFVETIIHLLDTC